MRDVFIIGDNIYSPLGASTDENFQQLIRGVAGVTRREDASISPEPFYASLFEKAALSQAYGNSHFTRFEQILEASIHDALEKSGIDPADPRAVLIISSTKGNISLLETEEMSPDLAQRISLSYSAQKMMCHFRFVNRPIIISNACISGILALLTAMRLIHSGKYNHAVVTGGDVVSQFVLTGFHSFQAISPGYCKPFDATRNGINLGEGAGTIVLSANKKVGEPSIRLAAGSVSNDANHISGPSRTGQELAQAIAVSLKAAGLQPVDIDFISAHGTATMYNDEMESLAFNLSELNAVPVNSLKGYFGHTLGAAGLIETIISTRSMQEDVRIPTKGFNTLGVSKPIRVCNTLETGAIRHLLKTASGFGGCNAALVLSKQ